MITRVAMATALATAATAPALAQQVTVTSLMKDGFTLVSTIPSPAGPGLFLVKGERMFFCVVAETPTSIDVATRYCKPVH
ncbi:MAG TPA: hypothetical protein VK438_02750 [Xanthobacteraceae bacterium]|nr:hypothetical protein [Xanthobacteraceae bacterium]